jgi:hypothetical protein
MERAGHEYRAPRTGTHPESSPGSTLLWPIGSHDGMGKDEAAGDVTRARFGAFAALFALALVLFHAEQGVRFRPNLANLSLGVALAVLMRPTSVRRFLTLIALLPVVVWQELPFANTSRTLLFLTCSAMTFATGAAAWRRRGLPDRAQVLDACGDVLRPIVIVVYAFAFFHKLNSGFLDPESSCAVALYAELTEWLSLLPLPAPRTIGPLAVYATLAVEGSIPVLLAFRRTRTLGVLVAVAMHVVFGVAGYYGFSMTMLAYLVFFTPADLPAQLAASCSRHLPFRLSRAWRGAVLTGVGLTLAWFTVVVWRSEVWVLDAVDAAWRRHGRNLFWIGFLATSLPTALACALHVRRCRPQQPWDLPRSRWLLVFTAIAVLNGLCPYVGLKTETAFAMYSNLRTEGGRSNHLLIRTPIALADYQTDLVRVVSSSDARIQRLAADGRRLPFLALRRHVAWALEDGAAHVAVTYSRDGRTHVVTAAGRDPELSAPLSFVEHHLLRFRVIPDEGANSCEH